MSLNYTTYQAELSTLTAIPATDPNFIANLPSCIDYAEGRIYRELDLIVEDVRDSSSTTTIQNRNFTLPTGLGTFQIVSQVNIITPSGVSAESGTRNPCTPVSRDVLDFTWPSAATAALPTQFCYFSQSSLSGQPNILFGPWPDQAYTVEIVGKIIPAPLSATNTTTFLTLYLPDLFLAASMIFMAGFMRNYGSQADNPQMAQSWETQYGKLLESAKLWEARKKFAGASWTSKQIEPSAQPQRG